MKPYVVCHMASSLDGRILPDRWRPSKAHSHALYEKLHTDLRADAWIVGRVTGQEFAKLDRYPDGATGPIPRTSWINRPDAPHYGIVIDARGKIAWGRSDLSGDPAVVLLTEQVTDSHLAALRRDGVGYIFAGEVELDLAQALEVLNQELGIKRLLLEGGGVINGAFLRAGLIDELSLMMVPAIDGAQGAPAVFDSEPNQLGGEAPLGSLSLISSDVLENGIVWLRYRFGGDRAETLQPG